MNKKQVYKYWLTIIGLTFFAILIFFASLHFGVYKITFAQIVSVFSAKLNLIQNNLPANIELIVWDVRFKRTFIAFLVGSALSVCGVVFQSLLRNPLADPHIIGVSSGGALGAVLAAVCGAPLLSHYSFGIPLFSFLGSLFALWLVYSLSKRKGVLSLYSLLLVGVIVNSFFVSIVIFLESIMRADELMNTFNWLLGSFSYSDFPLALFAGCVFAVGIILICMNARALNILTLGADKAKLMGVNVDRVVKTCFVAASVMTGFSVALSGLIGFVGLVVPHCVRMLFGSDNRIVIPASVLAGGTFMIIADTVARTIMQPQELPVGVVTSFVGAPFFIYILKRREV